MNLLQRKYEVIYGLFGGDNHKAPDIGLPEQRRPMLSLIKKRISEYKNQLYNVGDYLIHKDSDGYLSVNIEPELIYVYQSDTKMFVKLQESDMFLKIRGIK